MYANAVTSSPKPSLLSGLRTSGSVGAFAKGQAMNNAAGMGLDAAQKNQELGVQAMEQESRLRQAGNEVKGQRAGHAMQEGLARDAFQNRQDVFDTGMNYDYAQMFKQRSNRYLQALLDASARDF
jgi:hypothetical protein